MNFKSPSPKPGKPDDITVTSSGLLFQTYPGQQATRSRYFHCFSNAPSQVNGTRKIDGVLLYRPVALYAAVTRLA